MHASAIQTESLRPGTLPEGLFRAGDLGYRVLGRFEAPGRPTRKFPAPGEESRNHPGATPLFRNSLGNASWLNEKAAHGKSASGLCPDGARDHGRLGIPSVPRGLFVTMVVLRGLINISRLRTSEVRGHHALPAPTPFYQGG
jgi:hypothetical protein